MVLLWLKQPGQVKSSFACAGSTPNLTLSVEKSKNKQTMLLVKRIQLNQSLSSDICHHTQCQLLTFSVTFKSWILKNLKWRVKLCDKLRRLSDQIICSAGDQHLWQSTICWTARTFFKPDFFFVRRSWINACNLSFLSSTVRWLHNSGIANLRCSKHCWQLVTSMIRFQEADVPWYILEQVSFTTLLPLTTF